MRSAIRPSKAWVLRSNRSGITNGKGCSGFIPGQPLLRSAWGGPVRIRRAVDDVFLKKTSRAAKKVL